MVPPLLFFRDGRAGATGRNGLSHASRYCVCHVARVPKRRRKVPCGETEREFSETPGMPAGQTGGTKSGGLAGGDRTVWARGHHAGAVGLSEPATGRHVRRQSDGSRTGWRECLRRGPGESVTGPSRRCRRDGSLWGVTEAPATLGIFTTG